MVGRFSPKKGRLLDANDIANQFNMYLYKKREQRKPQLLLVINIITEEIPSIKATKRNKIYD